MNRTEEIEKRCILKIKEGDLDIIDLLQNYKINILKTKEITENTDAILSYFLLYLLSTGETRRYCLNRAEVSSIIENEKKRNNGFINIRNTDTLWKASLLGDIPQMKQSINSLIHTHTQIGEIAYNRLKDIRQNIKDKESEKKDSKIQQIIKASNMFFRV